MKYGKLNLGQIEAIVNKLGGMDGVDSLLSDEMIITMVTKVATNPFSAFRDQRPFEWGWKGVEREGALCEAPVDISKLELVPFYKDGEDWVSGEEMMRRAADKNAFSGCQGWSQHHAEDILSRADELPADWTRNDGPIPVFTDTVLLDDNGNRSVPYLVWFDGRWQLGWSWLDGIFGRRCRFFRLRK